MKKVNNMNSVSMGSISEKDALSEQAQTYDAIEKSQIEDGKITIA